MMKYCPACGNVVDDTAKFCFRCGHQFASAVASPSPTVADAPDAPADEPPSEPFTDAAMETSAPAETPLAEEDTPADGTVDAPAEDSPFVMEVRPTPVPMPTPTPVPMPTPTPVPTPAFDMPKPVQKPARELLSTAQYILLIILFSIPVVGIVFLFIFGCGNPKNTSLKRFSLAVLILTLIVWILVIAAAIVGYVTYADTLPTFLHTFQQWFAGLDLSALGL